MNFPVREGYCPICGVAIFDRGKTLANQCQFPVIMDNGSELQLGLCKDCFLHLTDEQIVGIFEGVKDWEKAHGFDMTERSIKEVHREAVW